MRKIVYGVDLFKLFNLWCGSLKTVKLNKDKNKNLWSGILRDILYITASVPRIISDRTRSKNLSNVKHPQIKDFQTSVYSIIFKKDINLKGSP